MRLSRPLSLCPLFAAIVTTGCFVRPGVVRAQDNPPDLPDSPEAAQAQPLQNLKEAFPHIAWDSKAHGVLLAIAPEKTTSPRIYVIDNKLEGDDNTPVDDAWQPLYRPTGRYGLNAGLVSRHFDRKLIHLPTMTVFAPTKMYTLNRELKPIDPFLGMSTEDKMRRLEQSLTPDQWKLLGSADGLGMADLNPDQQTLFASLLPESSEIRHTKMAESSPGFFYGEPTDAPSLKLSDEQRQGLRLRLDRVTNMFAVNTKGQQRFPPFFHPDAVGTEKLEVVERQDSFAQRSSVFGQQVRFKTPNRLKPSDLDLKSPSLNVWVPITGAATVGDLMAATRKATGLSLYADGRLAHLPIALQGGATPTVRAADLLEALCWAMTATYRRVGASANPKSVAYVLTFDREGLAVQHGLLGEWSQRGESSRSAIRNRFDKQIKTLTPQQYLAFAKGNLLDPTPEAEKAVLNFTPAPDAWTPTVPVSTLTTAQREQFQAGLKQLARQAEENPGNHDADNDPKIDRVGMRLELQLVFMIPGVGEFNSDYSWSDNTLPASPPSPSSDDEAKKSTPVPGTKITLLVAAPHDHAAVQSLMQSAVAHGVKQIWIRLPDTGPSSLTDCIAAGKTHHIAVGAVVSVMRSGAESPSPVAGNINIYGETAPQWAAHVARNQEGMEDSPFMAMGGQSPSPRDIADPGLPEFAHRLKARITAIAATPGLAGLALCDGAVTGYRGSQSQDYSNTVGGGFGYTPENRLAFLKKEGYDPIDLDPDSLDWDVRQVACVPFFDTDGSDDLMSYEPSQETSSVNPKWDDLRANQETAALKSLRTTLLNAAPKLPVYVCPENGADDNDWGTNYHLWEKPDSLPMEDVDSDELVKNPALIHGTYYLLGMSHASFAESQRENSEAPEKTTETPTETKMLCNYLHYALDPDPRHPKAQLPSGIVIDLSSYSTEEAIGMVGGVLLPVEAGAH